jgi:hypothetical protein
MSLRSCSLFVCLALVSFVARPASADPPPMPAYAPYPPPPPGYYWPPPVASEPPPPPPPYRDGDPIPPGYRLEESPRKGLVIAGSIVFGTFYGLTLLGASESNFDDGTGYLAIPVLGPVLYARHTDCEGDTDYCTDEVGDFFLTLDALGQATGAALFTLGMVFPKKRLVKDERFSVQIAPHASRSGAGAVAFGTF